LLSTSYHAREVTDTLGIIENKAVFVAAPAYLGNFCCGLLSAIILRESVNRTKTSQTEMRGKDAETEGFLTN